MAVSGIKGNLQGASFAQAEEFFNELFYGRGNVDTDQDPYSEPTSAKSRKADQALNTIPMAAPVSPSAFRAYRSHLKNIIEEIERYPVKKGVGFILSDTFFHVLNPQMGQGQIGNPAAAMFGPPPIMGGHNTKMFDPFLAHQNPGSEIPREQERLKQMYQGTYVKPQAVAGIPPFEVNGPDIRHNSGLNPVGGETLDEARKRLNLSHEDAPFDFSIISDYENRNTGNTTNNLQQTFKNGVQVRDKPDYDKLFLSNDKGPAFGAASKGAGFESPQDVRRPSIEYIRRRGVMEHDDTWFSKEDFEQGWVAEQLSDFDTYVPFYIQDLRKLDRYVYFRAFLTDLSERFSPQWNTDTYYGRVDPIGVYMNTSREISVGWTIAAFSAPGLVAMWRKINNFLKSVYPSFKDGVLSAAPIIRLRVGDHLATLGSGISGQGLPGFITSVNIDYNETTWEILETAKAPMICKMSVNFQVIHEENVEANIDESNNLVFKNARIFRKMGMFKEVLGGE